jgi:hypothetical protein
MKTRLTFLMLLLLIVSFGFGLARQPQQNSNSCGFAVQGEPAQPTVKGPDDIVPLVYVVEQPDSPRGHRYSPNVSCFAYQIDYGPMVLATLKMINRQLG